MIPGAVVTLQNLDNGASRQTVTNETGEYVFPQLPPGNYQVRVEKPGFSTVTKTGIALRVNTPATLDLVLEIGKCEEVVNVMADVAAINTEDASVGNAFSERQIRQLPLQTRNVVELLSLQLELRPMAKWWGRGAIRITSHWTAWM